MSLVAYGSSDESDNECQDRSTSSKLGRKPDATQTNDISRTTSQAQSINQTHFAKDDPASKRESNSINRQKEIFSSLPAPQSKISAHIDEKLDELPIKKTTVKISVPSLSEFKDDESEPMKKKLKPSAKGSGLFALLPAPKNVFLKGTKSADGSKTQAPLVPRVVGKPPIKTHPVIPKRFLKPTEEDLVPEVNQDSLDFFSLGSLNEVPEEDPVYSVEDPKGLTDSKMNLPPPRSWPLSESELPLPPSASLEETSSSDPQGDDNFISLDNGNIQLSEEALQKLCGRRATRQQQDVEVIDVSGAELLPDPKEWLTKQLTEERQLPSRGFGRRHDGPTSQQRRKHQITYLAFQAKENELELKNQWSQNRMSRKQTQSKYGF